MKKVMIDLHIHSIFSDGSDTIEELLNQFDLLKLNMVSITDHDTVDGIRAIKKKKVSSFTEIINGVELSVETAGKEIHVLGYNFSMESVLVKKIDYLKKANMRKYIDFLKSGDRFREERMNLEEAIALIHSSGGIAVLAHPKRLSLKARQLNSLINEWKRWGLDGIECFHPEHNKEEQDLYVNIAAKNKMIITAGSDYHGTNKKNILLGCREITDYESERISIAFEERIYDQFRQSEDSAFLEL